MVSAVQDAVRAYIRAGGETDAAARAQLLEACFAEDGRIVARRREIRGRAALADELTRLHADPEFVRFRLMSAVDAEGTTFRFRSGVERRDGTLLEFFDAGQVDSTGRIALVFTFAGPLAVTEE